MYFPCVYSCVFQTILTVCSGPGDLASIIAAKAASRRPMVGSPTKKDFPPEEDRYRSATMSRADSSSMSDARLDPQWEGSVWLVQYTI